MITTDGKLHIKRYLAKLNTDIARSIAFGIGDAAEAVGDKKLGFEISRSDIVLTSLDLVGDRLVYKASLPSDLVATIYEVGLFSVLSDYVAGEFSSKTLATFNSSTESWVDSTAGTDATYTTGTSRLGADSLSHTPALSTSKSDKLTQLSLDLSGYSGADKFVFAYNVGNANTSNIVFRFMTDTANYFDISLGSQTAGYKVTEKNKSTAVATGAPNWNNITEIRVTTTSGAGGASNVTFDGIRVEDTDTINPEYVMVSRELLTTPYVKAAGRVQEIEFSINLSVI